MPTWFWTVISAAGALIIFLRVIGVAGHFPRKHSMPASRFRAVGISYGLLFGGAVGVVASGVFASYFAPPATAAVLAGVSGLILFDRRTI